MFWQSLQRFSDPIIEFLQKTPKAIIIFVFGFIVIFILIKIFRGAMKISKTPRALSEIIISLAEVILWILLFSELAKTIGFSSLSLTFSGALVVLGLAIANGATGLISDLISGFFIAKDKDFEIGYRVKVADIEGIVQKVDVRRTRILSKNGHLHVISNSSVDKGGWVVIERNIKDDKIKNKRIKTKK